MILLRWMQINQISKVIWLLFFIIFLKADSSSLSMILSELQGPDWLPNPHAGLWTRDTWSFAKRWAASLTHLIDGSYWAQPFIGAFDSTYICSLAAAAVKKGLMILQQRKAQLEEQQTYFVQRHSDKDNGCCLRLTLHLGSRELYRSHSQCSHLNCSVHLCKIQDTSCGGYDKHAALHGSSYISWKKKKYKTHKSGYFCSSKQRQLALGCECTRRATWPTSEETNGLKQQHILRQRGIEVQDRHTTPYNFKSGMAQ